MVDFLEIVIHPPGLDFFRETTIQDEAEVQVQVEEPNQAEAEEEEEVNYVWYSFHVTDLPPLLEVLHVIMS